MSNDSFKYTPEPSETAITPAVKMLAGKKTGKNAKKEKKPKVLQALVPWSPAAAVVYTLVVYFAAQLIGSMVVILYPHLVGWDKHRANEWLDQSVTAQFWFVLCAEALTFGAIVWFIRRRGGFLRDIGWRKPQWMHILYAFGGFAVYFIGYSMILAVITNLFPGFNANQRQDIGFENAITPLSLSLTFVSLVVLPPIVEEFVFRGFLYTGLRNRMQPVVAALVTSVLFASAHLQFGSGKPLLWVAALDTFTLSLVLCYLRQKNRSLWPGIILHALKNAIAFCSLFIIASH
jgi:membrane protease YdiL (CAAX protease family)